MEKGEGRRRRTEPLASFVNVVLGSSRSAMLDAYARCCISEAESCASAGAGLGADVLVRGAIERRGLWLSGEERGEGDEVDEVDGKCWMDLLFGWR